MYCNFFGLRCRPFESRVDTQFTYITSEYEETLAAVEYEVQFGQKLAIILGDTGTGKTQLVRTLLLRFHRTDHAVVINCHVDSEIDLIRETCKGYGLTISSTQNQQDCISRLRRHLQRNTKSENRWILIIDQAENLNSENLSQLALLADIQGNNGQMLGIALLAQPRFRVFIQQSSIERFRQILVNARTLTVLSQSQTDGYIRHRLNVAGVGDVEVFDKDAIALIYETSGGVPRLINHYCNAVMLAAYGTQESRITTQIVLEVTKSSIAHERTAAVKELGLDSSRQVESGNPGVSLDRRTSSTRRSLRTSSGTSSEADRSFDLGHDTTDKNRYNDFQEAVSSGIGRSHEFTSDMESLFASGEALLQRLERALARADRMTGTTDASLSQFMAVEKHVDSVTTSAERYVNHLADGVQRGNDTLDKLQNRIERHDNDADQRLSEIESRMTRVIKASESIEERIERANRICDRVDQAESKVKLSAERLASKAQDIQQQITQLKSGVKISEDARTQLATLTRQSLTDISAAEAKVHKLIINAQEHIRHGEKLSEKFSDAALEQYQIKYKQQSDEYEHSRQEAMDQLKKTANESVESAQKITEQTISVCQEKLQTQVDQYQDALNEALASRLANSQAKLDTMVHTTRREIDEMSRRVELVEGKRKQAELWAKPLCQDAEKIADQIENLHHRLQKVRVTIDEMSARAETSNTTLSATVQRGEQLLSGVQASHAQIENERNSIISNLAEVNRSADRVKELRDQTNVCEQAIQRLTFENESGEKTVQRIQQLAEHVEQLQTNMQSTMTDAAEKIGQLDSRTHAVNSVIHNLNELNTSSENTVEKVESMVRDAQRAVEIVNSQSDRLDQVQKLTETVEDARQLYDAMQGLVSHSDVKIGELDTRHHAAEKILDELSKHKTNVDQFIDRTNQAEEAAGKINRLIEDVWSLTSKTENENKQLSQNIAEASQIRKDLAIATDPARDVAGDLAEKAKQIEQHKNAMEKGLAQAGKLVGRLASITRVLSAAKNTEATVKRTVEEVRAAHNELAATVEEAAQHSTNLQGLSAASQELIQTQHQLQQETLATTEELARQLATTQTSVETGERLLKDFVVQAETLNDRFVELDKKANDIKGVVEDNLNKPASMLKQVKSQSTQLEKVSAAVRKVFSNLSKATLQAQEKTKDLKQSVNNSNQHLSTINTKTQQASKMLYEWIEEAVRAQSRLQKTLGDCPTIQETHSREALLGMSRMSSISRDPMGESPGELNVMKEPDASSSSLPSKRISSPSGADEISRMIEDAKRATTGAGS